MDAETFRLYISLLFFFRFDMQYVQYIEKLTEGRQTKQGLPCVRNMMFDGIFSPYIF